MTPRPAPPSVDRAAASQAAVAARRARAAIKKDVSDRTRSPLEVASAAWNDPASPEAGLRVRELLLSVPSLGPAKVDRALGELAISERKRLGGLGSRQRVRLTEYLISRTPAPPARLTVLAGPTAVGKGTVSSYIRENYPDIQLSVSATTRSPRPGEVDGVHYYFVNDDEFDRMIDGGELLEWATVHNSYRYGTPRAPIEQALAAGRRVLLEIDLQGARSVRRAMPEAKLIFLLPPTWEELVRRLTGRGTESAEEQQRRLDTAKVELAAQDEFDAHVVNTDVGVAAREVVELMDAPAGATAFRPNPTPTEGSAPR
ncbi:guanylate kinase [Microbacteriaceae bacterium SG_E_30_P1]|uniref:Guanylate kinase n=1 Tax=Antiquaquibacter oligotrophicus TaxID=2880260 RepID=A0ABT6KPF2_9MICO|nr:guanylate kinase [Antiquaquibacter oligotrophicus]MDH6180972.1 guanylate kinase [Antiquaquibacter oligotrophicus]UDF13328.1 guanylate kinase [Antiquaquibacter oligotrophicus]